jgi:hypothetical protein
MATFEANPLAQEKFNQKAAVTSPLNTAEWAQIPAELRDRALFSATVENVKFLDKVGNRLQTFLDNQRREEGAFQSREKFIAELSELAESEGLSPAPGKKGTMEDLTSERRLKLIFDQNVTQAQSFAKWKAEQDPDVLDAYPAQELVRIEGRREPRDWPSIWRQHGGTIRGGRMVALKSDPIWEKISRFGVPWPPFDFGSGMGLRDIRRKDAERLGLIKPGEKVEGAEKGFNERLEAGIKNLSPQMRNALKNIFGDQVELTEETVRWTQRKPSILDAPTAPEPVAPAPMQKPEFEKLAPAGPKVSDKVQNEMQTQMTKNLVTRTTNTINEVHGDGPLKQIPFDHNTSKNAHGTYWSYDSSAVSIGVKKNVGEHGPVVLTHEVGHWLDHVGIPSPSKFASHSHPELAQWRDAVTNSDAYKAMQADSKISRKYKTYTLRKEEMFARSYAQFIATESGSEEMLNGIKKVLNGETGYPAWTQWQDEDFKPIRKAFRDFFIKLGWMASQ